MVVAIPGKNVALIVFFVTSGAGKGLVKVAWYVLACSNTYYR